MREITQQELARYVATLPEDLRKVFYSMHDVVHVKKPPEKLDNDFQVAVSVLGVFKRFAADRMEGKSE